MEKEIVDRSMYREIKKMDRAELNSFLNKIYKMGVEDAEGSLVSKDALKDAILSVPGIGSKRTELILLAIEPLFRKGSDSGQT